MKDQTAKKERDYFCDKHGKAEPTIICKQLLGASNVAWYSFEPTAEDPWHDAFATNTYVGNAHQFNHLAKTSFLEIAAVTQIAYSPRICSHLGAPD